jgi:hypothetical protein
MVFDYTAYMKDVSTRLKAIAHDDSAKTKKFFRISSVANIDEIVQHFTHAGTPCLMVEDNRTGRYIDNDTLNYIDNQSYAFMVLQYCKVMDAESREEAKQDTLAIVHKIIAKMKKDKYADLQGGYPKTGLRDFDMNSVFYQTIGPVADNYYGTLVQFAMLSPANTDLIYDEDDWTNGLLS